LNSNVQLLLDTERVDVVDTEYGVVSLKQLLNLSWTYTFQHSKSFSCLVKSWHVLIIRSVHTVVIAVTNIIIIIIIIIIIQPLG